MRHAPQNGCQFFFTTTPLPCPYLDGQVERRVVTELIGRNANELHHKLSLGGFRRSHGIAYAPACPSCQACIPVRVDVDGFKPTRSQRRVLSRNLDIIGTPKTAKGTDEQYALFARYIRSRHADGDMVNMAHTDYLSLVEDTPVDSQLVEFRDSDGQLVAGCLVDGLSDGLSAVYSFFEPTLNQRSLGTLMVLRLIAYARELGLPYLYLGYWIEQSPKMAYKNRYQPLQGLQNGHWHALTQS